MAASVQPIPKSTSTSKRGVTEKLISFILIIAAVIIEPVVTRAVGISKSPKGSRFSSFLPGRGKTNLKWYQRLYTLKGWKLNFRISSEQWKSRLAALYAFASRLWSSLGAFRYVAAVAIVLVLGYSMYLLWKTGKVQSLLKPTGSALNGHVVAPANGTATANGAVVNGAVVKPNTTSPTPSKQAPSPPPSKVLALLPWKRTPPPARPAPGTRFDVDAAYSSPEQASTSIIQDIRRAGLKVARGDIKTLLEVAFSTGKPVDDKKMAVC